MPRNQGNKVAPAAELGDGFDLAAALRVRLVPLVPLVRRLDEFSRFLEVASLCVAARPCPRRRWHHPASPLGIERAR